MSIRVLMLGWEFPPFNSGGLGEACMGISKSLAGKGVEVTFVLPYELPLKASGIRIVFATGSSEEINYFGSYDSSGVSKKFFPADSFPPDFVLSSIKYAQYLKKIIHKLGRFDVIHMHDWMTFPAGIMAKEVLKLPLVAHIHSTEIDRSGGILPNQHVYNLEKTGMEVSDKVVVVGGFMKKELTEHYGISPEKIEVVYNGVDSVKKDLSPILEKVKRHGSGIVLFLGRITLQKGPEYFVRAAAKTLKHRPETLFIVTGSGDMTEYMISETVRLGIADKFIFTGFLRGEERDRIFQSADVFVMPSVSEPFGITALESIVNETPVIISKTSGASEVLKNVLKVDFWDIDEMADKIIAVLNHTPLSQDLVEGSKKEVETLTWDKNADEIINIYRNLNISS